MGEGDTGPNTGGMGSYSPAPVLTPEIERQVSVPRWECCALPLLGVPACAPSPQQGCRVEECGWLTCPHPACCACAGDGAADLPHCSRHVR